jgi:dipeptidase E
MPESKRQIIVLGGAGFSVEPLNLALDGYILAQAKRQPPAVCFLGTASGDPATYISKFYAAYSQLDCRPTHLLLFDRTPDLRSFLLRQDVIFVGGGNTKSMLAVWREWRMPEFLREAWENGVVLAGISAGAICWFEAGLTDSWADRLAPLPCLGFLPGAACPHYDGEPERRPALHHLIAINALPTTLALDDGVAAHFVGTKLSRLVSSGPDANGYSVELHGGLAIETALPAERLTSAMLE